MNPVCFDQDPYKILQVDPGAETETIAAAYRSLAKRYHPDMNPGADAGERMKEINWAYVLLGDPVKRAEFDRHRATPTHRPEPFYPPSFDYETAARAVYEAFRREGMTCQGCGEIAPTQKVRFERNIGMIFSRRIVTIEGLFCRKCIEEKFWEFTGKLLLFGWWGTISFFATWFYLIVNLITYLRSIFLETREENIWVKAFGWKLVCTMIFGIMIWALSGMVTPRTLSVTANRSTSTAAAAVVGGGNKSESTLRVIVLPTAKPTSMPVISSTADCLNWREVNLSHAGKTLCVTCIVVNAYNDFSGAKPIFYIAFGAGNGDFYMVAYNGFYDNLNGTCVKVRAKISQIGASPMMVVDDNLYTITNPLNTCR